ncbi:TIGR01841 family phasin [Dechloromonas denitrificans]|uniref:TIGR01841 family phasin n=1 Tax=Azonexaceae TaxID=2008795 RepID=UPI001CF8506A|nr:TIGR01841 family phasin [Dechloromonas denitrificans]
MNSMLQCSNAITAQITNPQEIHIMFTKPQDFTKSGFDFALFFANTTFEGFERLALLNLAATRSLFEASIANITTLLGAKDVQSFVTIQKAISAPSIEQGLEYSRNVISIAAETKDKLAKEVETKVAEGNAKVSGLVEKALAAAPAGSEVAVAAVKSAIKSANAAYEGLNKAAKQAADVAEASVSAATQATLKAANVAAPKAAGKKAA